MRSGVAIRNRLRDPDVAEDWMIGDRKRSSGVRHFRPGMIALRGDPEYLRVRDLRESIESAWWLPGESTV
jgi:hypothetical protein